MSAFSDYMDELRELLHDSNDQFWSEAQKLNYINAGRDRVVRDTGSYRVLQGGYLSPSREVFTYGGVTGVNITNGGTGYSNSFSVTFIGGDGLGALGTATAVGGIVKSVVITVPGTGFNNFPTVNFSAGGGVNAAGTASILRLDTFDVVNLTLYWGNSRVALSYLPWSKFNAKARYYVNYIGRPVVFSTYSSNSVYIQPLGDQLYQCEWDTVVRPPALVNTATIEVIPFPFRSPVAFYGAYKAKLKEQSWGEAEAFLNQYKMQVMSSINSAFTRRSPNPYAR